LALIQLFRDPFWQGVAFVGCLLAIFVPIYFADKAKKWSLYAAIICGCLLVGSVGIRIYNELQITYNLPAPSWLGGNGLPIESVPFEVSSYAYGKDMAPPDYYSRLYVVNRANAQRAYRLEFSLPTQSDSGAGILFYFAPSRNLTDYAFIEIALAFEDAEARCHLYVKDIKTGDHAPYIDLGGGVPTGVQAKASGNTVTYRIPLKTYFGSLDMNAINALGCEAWQLPGKHVFTLSDIKFAKQ
jgi:hypothetical protein